MASPDDDHDDEEERKFLALPVPLANLLGGAFQGPSQEQIDRHHMALEEKHARFKRFFAEQTVENLATFGQMMSDLVQLRNPSEYASYLQGTAEAILEHLHDVCGQCGVDHDSLDQIADDKEGEAE